MQKIWVYPKITVNLKFLLFYPNPKGDKSNFKWVSVQKWDTPKNIPKDKIKFADRRYTDDNFI
jgi:hypothetical protein